MRVNLRRLRRWRLPALLVAFLLPTLTVLILAYDDISLNVLLLINWSSLEDITCHYTVENDALPAADDILPPPIRSIFFHETSCKGHLNARQACAVESAARANPNHRIHVLFSGPVTMRNMSSGILKDLMELDNVVIARINNTRYAEGTPLAELVVDGALQKSLWRIAHTSDLLRYLTLYRWGGIYLDMDVVVVKPLGSLARNWAALESDHMVGAGAMSFSRDKLGRRVAEEAVRYLKKKFRGDTWSDNGPVVITKVLEKLCSTDNVRAMSAATCEGFEVYGPQFFYPVVYSDWKVYFRPGNLSAPDAYIYHVWNHASSSSKVPQEAPYAKLARRYCPTVYEKYKDDF